MTEPDNQTGSNIMIHHIKIGKEMFSNGVKAFRQSTFILSRHKLNLVVFFFFFDWKYKT